MNAPISKMHPRFLFRLVLALQGFVFPVLASAGIISHKPEIGCDPGIVENRGQLSMEGPAPLFYFGSRNAALFFYRDRVEFIFPAKEKPRRDTVSLYLAGSSPAVRVEGTDKISYRTNYYIGDRSEWVSNVSHFNSLVYREVYPGIDMRFLLTEQGLKYEFILRPGADYRQIKLRWAGLEQAEQMTDGSMRYRSAAALLEESRPLTYSETGQAIGSRFRLAGKDEICFELDPYAAEETLTIDPELKWTTYYSSWGFYDEFRHVFTNKRDELILGGKIGWEDDYPISTRGKSWSDFYSAGNTNALEFIGKFDTGGSRVWGTYIFDGQSLSDYSYAMDMDDTDNIYIAGGQHPHYAKSFGSGIQDTIYDKNWSDGVIVKLDSTGAFIWGRYFGGNKEDGIGKITVDKKGEILVAGSTRSNVGIATSGTGGFGGNWDGFVAKFTNSGKLIWSRYLGGANDDGDIRGITTDTSGNIYIAGRTNSIAGFATSGAYLYSFKPSDILYVGFLVKLDSLGKTKWGTYYYDSTYQYGKIHGFITSVDVDPAGDVYICGSDYNSLYLARFDKNGKHRFRKTIQKNQVSTTPYVSSSAAVAGMDSSGNVYIVGMTNDSTVGTPGSLFAFVDTAQHIQPFLIKTNSLGEKIYGTYLYGKAIDALPSYIAMAKDSKNGVYIAGKTKSFKMATKNAFDTSKTANPNYNVDNHYHNSDDAILTRVVLDPDTSEAGLLPAKSSLIPKVCEGNASSMSFWLRNYGTTSVNRQDIYWSVDDTAKTTLKWTGYVSSGDSLLLTFEAGKLSPGVHKIKAWIKDNEPANDTVRFDIEVYPLPKRSAGKDQAVCIGNPAILGAAPDAGYTYSWTDSAAFADTAANPIVAPKQTTMYYLKITDKKTKCSISDSVEVIVNPLPQNRAGKEKKICYGEKTIIGDNSLANYSYRWYTKAGTLDTVSMPHVEPKETTTYYLDAEDTITHCSRTDSVTVIVYPLPELAGIEGQGRVCQGTSAWYTSKAKPGDKIAWYRTGGKLVSDIHPDKVLIEWDSVGEFSLKAVHTSVYGCRDSVVYSVVVDTVVHPAFFAQNDCVNKPLQLENKTEGSAKYLWRFPDGSTDTAFSPSRTFTKTGTYKVWLKATTPHGCTDSVSNLIVINSLPSVDWVIRDKGKGKFQFAATDSLDKEITWRFGTGDSSAGNAFYSYKENGTYPVQLYIVNKEGCDRTRDTSLVVDDIPSGWEEYKSPEFSCSVFPNPFRDRITLETRSAYPGTVRLILTNTLGEQILARNMAIGSGTSRQDISLYPLKLTPGIYFLRIINGSRVFEQKIIKR